MNIMRTRIATESAKIFNDSIWKRWESTWNTVPDNEILAGMITRQVASHVADRLSLPPAFHHPDEFYIVPPLISERLDTGDLIEDGDVTYVVVTPRCNMANEPYPTHLTLAACNTMTTELEELRSGFFGAGEGKQRRTADRLRNFAVQNHSSSTHFIPPCGDRGPWLVDFRETMGVPSVEMPRLLTTRFASIASQFIPNLVQRYAAYLGRIGQPDLDVTYLKQHICGLKAQ